MATDPALQQRPVRVESHGFSSVAQLLPALETVKRLLSEVRPGSSPMLAGNGMHALRFASCND